MISRRGIIGTLAGLIAAPAIIKVADLMPVKSMRMTDESWMLMDGHMPGMELDDTVTFAGEQMADRQFTITAIGRNTLLSVDDITRGAVRMFNEHNPFLNQALGEKLRVRLPSDWLIEHDQGDQVRRAWADLVVKPVAHDISPVQAAALGAAALVASNPTVSRRFWNTQERKEDEPTPRGTSSPATQRIITETVA